MKIAIQSNNLITNRIIDKTNIFMLTSFDNFSCIYLFLEVESCLNKKSNTAYILLLEKAVTKNTYSQQGVSHLIHKHSYWKNIFHGWNMAQYFFHRYIWEVYCNSPILLLFDMFILPLSWCLRKEKKVILLMGILMVAMTVSYRGIASFVSQTFNIEKDEDKFQF